MLKIFSLFFTMLLATSCVAAGAKQKTHTKTKKKSTRTPANSEDGSFELLKGKEDYSIVMAQLEVNLDKCLRSNDNINLSCIVDFDDHNLYSLTAQKSFLTSKSAPECIISLTNRKLVVAYSGKAPLKFKRDAIPFYATCLNNSGFSKTNTNPRKSIYTSKVSLPFVSW